MPEIERKFRLPGPPPSELLRDGESIDQGYILTDPAELRLRRRGHEYYLTVKGSGSLTRSEWETTIPQHVFESLWPQTEGRRLEKIRYIVPMPPVTLEIDEYRGRLAGLYVLEVEFSSESMARTFVLPDWAANAVDVTSDPSYKNKRLALAQRPPNV